MLIIIHLDYEKNSKAMQPHFCCETQCERLNKSNARMNATFDRLRQHLKINICLIVKLFVKVSYAYPTLFHVL